MFGKLLLLVLSLGVIGAKLLVLRQGRIDATHRITVLHGRILDAERRLWRLEGDVEQAANPIRVAELVERHGGVRWQPIPDPTVPPGTAIPTWPVVEPAQQVRLDERFDAMSGGLRDG